MLETPAPSLERPALIDRRNLLRADWRVLLPVPPDGFEHMVLLGGPEGLGEVIVEIGLARKVSTALPTSQSADAVAILANATTGCETAAASLVPGGTLYWEVESERVRAGWIQADIRRSLRRSGLSLTGLYWVRPDFEHCEVFIPVDVQTAVEWYLRSWANGSSPLRRILGSSVGAALASHLVGPVLRHCAVTAVAGRAGEAGPSILSHPAVPSDFRRAGALPLVMNRGGRDGSRRVVVFPFRADSREPVGVLKFSRLAERNLELEEEEKIAADVRSRLSPDMRRTIPAPLGTFSWGRILVGVETYAGRPIANHPPDRRRLRVEDLRLVERWLQEFHRQTQISRDPFSPAQLQTCVDRPLTEYRAAFGDDPGEEALFDRVRRTARSLLGSPFPVVWSHGGFSEFNICRSGEGIRVIDWEAVGPGPALVDLIYFVTIWYHRCRPRGSESARSDSFRKLFFPSYRDPLAVLATNALDAYMTDLSLDRRFFPVMLVLTWVIRALGQLKRNRTFGEQPTDRRNGNHVGFLRILAENQDRLFRESG